MNKPDQATHGRREFLCTVGALAVLSGVAPAAQARVDEPTPDPKRAARFRDTEHVRRFYQVNRYPR